MRKQEYEMPGGGGGVGIDRECSVSRDKEETISLKFKWFQYITKQIYLHFCTPFIRFKVKNIELSSLEQ